MFSAAKIAVARALDRAMASRVRIVKWLESVGSLLLMAVFQIISFVLLARVIGAAGYGVIVSIAATVTIAVEFVGLGCGDLFIREVARDKSAHSRSYGNALLLVLVTLPVVCLIAVAFERLTFRIDAPYMVVAALTFSELSSARASGLAEHVAIAHERIRIANIYRLVAAVSRMLMVLAAYFLVGVRSLSDWWPWQFAYGLIVPAAMLIDVAFRFGLPVFSRRIGAGNISFSFAGTQILRALQTNVDRIAVGHVFDAATLGTYGVAARLIQFTFLPIQAIMRMTYPRFFQHGRGGISETRRYAWRLAPLILILAIAIALGVFVGAGVFASVLGPGFARSQFAIQMLSALVIPIGLQYIFADALSGAEMQRLRTVVLLGGVVLTGVACWFGASHFGIVGVTLANLSVNVLLAGAFVLIVEVLARRKLAPVPAE